MFWGVNCKLLFLKKFYIVYLILPLRKHHWRFHAAIEPLRLQAHLFVCEFLAYFFFLHKACYRFLGMLINVKVELYFIYVNKPYITNPNAVDLRGKQINYTQKQVGL